MTTEPKYQLSVVIPTHNRRAMLERCLKSLAEQNCDPSRFEVVVIDDGSSDGTGEMVECFGTPFELRLISRAQGGWAAAQNAGIEAAAGRVCLLIDDDIIASPDLVAAHIAGQEEQGGQAIGIGPLTQVPPRESDWYSRAFAAEWNKHYALLAERRPGWMDCYGGNLSAPREALLRTGGFAADLAGAADVELAFRLCGDGLEPRFFPRAKASHDDQKQTPRLLRDAAMRGTAYLQIAARHPTTAGDLLGTFRTGSGREVAIRRALIALRVPPRLLTAAGGLVPGERLNSFLHHAIQRYAFWLSVRRQVDARRWRELTGDQPLAGSQGEMGEVAPEPPRP